MAKQEKALKGGLKSKYAKKLMGGNQMYGPGCCAHTVTQAQINKRKEEARRNGHFRGRQFLDDGAYVQDGEY